MNALAVSQLDEGRPIVVSRRQRKQLEAIAAGLARKNFTRDAVLVRELVASWDGAAGFVVVHEAALAGRPDPEGEPA